MDFRNLLATLERPIALLERAGLIVAGAAFAAMMSVTVIDVVMRYLFNSPLSWSFELISSYLMVGAFFLAVSATQARRQHVHVDLLARKLPERLRCALAVPAGCAVVLLFALIGWAGATGFWEAWQRNLVMDGQIPWPRWPTYLLIPVGLGLMVPRLVLEVAGDALAAFSGDLRSASHRRSIVARLRRLRPTMATATLIGLLLLLLAIGVPVAFSMGVAGMAGLYLLGGSSMVMGILSTTPLSSVSTYELLTIPMFILMAEIVIVSRIADELFETMTVWVGRVRGGLAIATAFAGAGFGAISGSSTAGAATLASTSLPAMIRQGYERRLANGVVAISGTLAMLIPPSMAVILYALVADESVSQLLIAGLVPGLLVTLTIAATVYILCLIDPRRAPPGRGYSWREKLVSLKVTGSMVVLMLLVTGVIYLGVATPTEAACLGAFGALCIALVRRRMTWRALFTALGGAARTSAMISMIIVGAHIFSYGLTVTQTTQQFVAWVSALPLDPYAIIAIIVLLYLVLGCFLDQIAILILTVPILLPVVKALGFDGVWFGIVLILTAEVGMVTPPVGMNAFVVARYTGRPVDEVFAGVFPHVGRARAADRAAGRVSGDRDVATLDHDEMSSPT